MMNRNNGLQRSSLINWLRPGLICLVLCPALGCQSLMNRNSVSSLHDPEAAAEAHVASLNGESGGIVLASGEQGTSSVLANPMRSGNEKSFREYNSARNLFEQGNYRSAESAFKNIADKHQLDETGFGRKRRWTDVFKTRSQLAAHYTDSPLREDSLFMLAESQYKQDKLPDAETSYLQLLEDYPNTRHMDAATQRLFDIAMTWMDFKVAKSGDVELASFSDHGPSSKPQVVRNEGYKKPSFFNFTDKRRPTTDTSGRALEALKAIWLNDPTGKLADDALMLTASHYLRTGRYAEASETYRLLREEFPQSPHAKDAYVLGGYVSQASYQGAAYDGKNLTEARQLQLTALNLYPDLPPEERERIKAGLQKLDDATVAREFNNAIFWLRKAKFESVEMTCRHIITAYPSSKYADKARGLLKMLPEYRKKNPLVLALGGINADSIPSVPILASPMPDPAPAAPAQIAPEQEEAPKSPSRFPGFRMPKLKPVPVPNLLPKWSREPEKKLELEPLPTPSEKSPPESGRVKLTLGQE